MNLNLFRYITLSVVLTAALMLLSACSNSDDAPTTAAPAETAPQEVLFNANVHRMLDGTRANTIDSNTLLQGQDLMIDAYYHGTNEKYLDGKTLHYDSSEPAAWKFWNTSTSSQEHYYWPFEGSTVAGGSTVASTLDFVGFCPFDKPSYIGDPTYNHSTGVSFTANMADYMTLASQGSMQEFLVSVLPNQTLATQTAAAGGALPMVFKHPFALIKFTITAASGTHVQINSISIADLNTNATCTYNGTTMGWGTYTGSAAMTLAQVLKNGGTTVGTPFVVIPKNYGTKYLTVNATWNDWGNVTITDYGTDVAFNWEPGHIYTYNLTLDKYGLKVDAETFTEQW